MVTKRAGDFYASPPHSTQTMTGQVSPILRQAAQSSQRVSESQHDESKSETNINTSPERS